MKKYALFVLGFVAAAIAWSGGIIPGMLVTAGVGYLTWRALTR
jgi:hypothetical protein